MSGITDLSVLLRSISPVLTEPEYVFITLADLSLVQGLDALCTFREQEAITVICPKTNAEAAGLAFVGGYREIVLNVHSSLEAVGFMAVVATGLARHNIPCNAVSAYYHDHIFVPSAMADRAVEVLLSLRSTSTSFVGKSNEV